MCMSDAVVLDGHRAPVAVPGFRSDAGVHRVSGPGGGVKRVRLNRKTPAHLVGHGILGVSVSATGLEETENSAASRFRSPWCQGKEGASEWRRGCSGYGQGKELAEAVGSMRRPTSPSCA